jgi:hypothetical protein
LTTTRLFVRCPTPGRGSRPLRATWWIERDGKRRATLAVRPFRALTRAEREEVAAEGRRMIDFAAGDAELRDLRFETAVA